MELKPTSRPATLTEKALGFKQILGDAQLTPKDCILYALGIGLSQDPSNLTDLRYTFEKDQKIKIFPTIASILGQKSTSIDNMYRNPHLPHIDIHTILHGQERLYMIHDKINLNHTYRIKYQLIDAADKGKDKGAVLLEKIMAFAVDEKGQEDLAYYIERTGYARSLGGSGLKGKGLLKTISKAPKRKADYVLKEQTVPNQAILYRLSSGPNPIHIDPQTAKNGGFDRPILHGLAIYGAVCKRIVLDVLKNQPQRIASIEVRFTSHVFPGQTLKINVWNEAEKLIFQAWGERKTKVIMGSISIKPYAKL